MLDGKILFDSNKGIFVPREQRPVGAVLQVDCVNSIETVRDNLTDTFNRTLKHRRIFKLDFLIELLELGSILDHSIELLPLEKDNASRWAVPYSKRIGYYFLMKLLQPLATIFEYNYYRF